MATRFTTHVTDSMLLIDCINVNKINYDNLIEQRKKCNAKYMIVNVTEHHPPYNFLNEENKISVFTRHVDEVEVVTDNILKLIRVWHGIDRETGEPFEDRMSDVLYLSNDAIESLVTDDYLINTNKNSHTIADLIPTMEEPKGLTLTFDGPFCRWCFANCRINGSKEYACIDGIKDINDLLRYKGVGGIDSPDGREWLRTHNLLRELMEAFKNPSETVWKDLTN